MMAKEIAAVMTVNFGMNDADGKIEFQQQDAALPCFPVEAKSILQWAPTWRR